MSEVEKRIRAQANEAFKALNPDFYGVTSGYHAIASKPPINDSGAIAPHFIRESTDESKLNKTEKAYLGFLRSAGHHWIGIQCISLKLGDDCRYNPDFLVLNASGFLEVHEVKGFMREDALVKLKTAARMYRFFKFLVVRRLAGQWQMDQVRP